MLVCGLGFQAIVLVAHSVAFDNAMRPLENALAMCCLALAVLVWDGRKKP